MDEDTHPPGQAPSNVVALESYRARLAVSRRGRRVAALFAEADPERAIRALPGDELYYLLREEDPSEAKDLLAYAKPEQIQIVLDLGLWSGDRLAPARMEEWVAVMAEMPFETIGRWVQGLDTELVALLIRKGARIYDLSMEEAPEEPVGIAYPTPDRSFVLDVTGYVPENAAGATETDSPGGPAAGEEDGPGAPVSAQALIHIIDAMYRSDLRHARRILVGARSELDSELEETALRWRQGRMADLGFIDAIEALEIYRELDPATVHIGELRPGTRTRPRGDDAGDLVEPPSPLQRAPAILAEELGRSSLFARAVARVTARAELEEIHFALVALANRVLAADRIDPADDQAVAAGIKRMRATLDLGVEYLARGGGRSIDEERAVDAVRTVSLLRLHRLGVSLVAKVRALARALVKQGPFSMVESLDLVEEPEATVLAAVNRARPVYPALLDEPPANGERPFGTLAEIARAAAAIQRAAAAQAMLLGLGVRPQHLTAEALYEVTPADRAAIDAGVVARTALLLLAKDGAGPDKPSADAFRPLTPVEAARFGLRSRPASTAAKSTTGRMIKHATNAGPTTGPNTGPKVAGLPETARRILNALAPAGLGAAAQEVIDRWIVTLSPLEPVLVRSAAAAPRRRATPAPKAPKRR